MDLFPRLPEDIGRECLFSVPYQFHSKLRAVCRSWESLLNSPRFYADRKLSGTSEKYVCLIQAIAPSGDSRTQTTPVYALNLCDPLQGLWRRHLPSLPELSHGIPLFCECVSVNQKLILIGGWHATHWETTKSVFFYEFSSGRWRRGADMPAILSFFACSVSPDGLIYVAGGHDDGKNALREAAVYNVEEDRWESLPPIREERDESRGAFVDGRFYVVSGYDTRSQGRFKRNAEVFDPNIGEWTTLENMWTGGGCPRWCTSAVGHLYAFLKEGVMRYDPKLNVWKKVGSLPPGIECVTCATGWRDGIFVCGSVGCSDDGGHHVCFIFRPPNPNSREEGTKFETWVAIERRENFTGLVQSAATVEI